MLKRNTYYCEKLWVTWSFICRLLSDRWRLSSPCVKLWFMFQVTHNYNIQNVSDPYWIPCTRVQYLWLRRFLAICKHTSLWLAKKLAKWFSAGGQNMLRIAAPTWIFMLSTMRPTTTKSSLYYTAAMSPKYSFPDEREREIFF